MGMAGMAMVLALILGPHAASANVKQSAKLSTAGMKQWRDGDFLGAFGSCYGAKKILEGSSGKRLEGAVEALGYAELCIGLALKEMKVRAGPHDYCKAFVASQKHFAVVDAVRKKRGQKLADGGYMVEQLKDNRCR